MRECCVCKENIGVGKEWRNMYNTAKCVIWLAEEKAEDL